MPWSDTLRVINRGAADMEHRIGDDIWRICPLATVVTTNPTGQGNAGALPTQLRFELDRSLLKLAGGWTHLAPYVKRLRGGATMKSVKASEATGADAKLVLTAECLDDMLAIAAVAEFLDAKIGVALADAMFQPTPKTEELRRRRLDCKLGRN